MHWKVQLLLLTLVSVLAASAEAQPVCTGQGDSSFGAGEYITSVGLDGQAPATSGNNGGYLDTTTVLATLSPNQAATLAVGFNSAGGTYQVTAWVDWNNNNTSLGETAEKYIINGGSNFGAGPASTSGTITVPGFQGPGTYRIRVKVQFATTFPDFCATTYNGEAEDHRVTVAAAQVCGNQTREGTEVCDGSDLASQSCSSQGFDEGTLACNGSCTGFVTAGCASCGDTTCNGNETTVTCVADCGTSCGDGACNGGESTANCFADCGSACADGVANGTEVCDGADLLTGTCANQGFDEGTLACNGTCTAFVTGACTSCGDGSCNGTESLASCATDCSVCGDGSIDGLEVCDDGDSSGGDGCTADCLAIETHWACPSANTDCVCAATHFGPICANAIISVGTGGCTLQDAITAANTNAPAGSCPAGSGADRIELPSGNYPLGGVGLTITEDLTIKGLGFVVIDGQSTPGAVITVIGVTLTVEQVRIRGGLGGGIQLASSLICIDSEIAFNSSPGNGGGILATGGSLVSLTRCAVYSNHSDGNGGGISIEGTSTFTSINSTIASNTADGEGGGVHLSTADIGTALTHTTIALNSGTVNTGGINVGSGLALTSSIVSGNTTGGADADVTGAPGTNVNNSIGGVTLAAAAADNGGSVVTVPPLQALVGTQCDSAEDARAETRAVGTCTIGAYEV
ncbi:MAG: cysteine-rich repeat protein, partial [Myxococcota bacterium]